MNNNTSVYTKNDEVLSGKQAALFASIMIFSSKLLVLPSLLYSENGVSGIFSVLIIFALEFLFLLFLIKVKQKKNIVFYKLFEKYLGKILTKIILFLIFLVFICKTLYILQESFTFLKYALYSDATLMVYLVCVIPVITAVAYKGLKAFGRTLEIFYAIIIVLIVFCTFAWTISVEDFSFSILFNGTGAKFFECLYKYTFWFGDFLFLMYIMDKVKLQSGNVKNFYHYSILSFVVVLVFLVVYFLTFQTTSFVHTYAIYDIIQFGNNLGTIGKFDLVAVSAIMFIIYFQLGMILYCANGCLNDIFKFGHKAQSYIFLNLFLIFISFLFFNNENLLIIYFGDYLKYLSIFVFYVVPIIYVCLVVKSLKSDKNQLNLVEHRGIVSRVDNYNNAKIINNNIKIIKNKLFFNKYNIYNNKHIKNNVVWRSAKGDKL